ncbi:MAG: MCP four helix bundle domain-containing protein, partial [Candidatus Parabeggiatoa sp.]|nr:MCP four helix bundle domain-containing protein [Candidatus Parabeggiatoa sp.]
MINAPSSTQLESGKRITFFRSMRGKLIMLFLAVSLIPLAIVGGVAITQLQAAKAAANEVSDNYFPSIINLDNAELALMHIIEAQKNHIIAPDDATMRAMETEIQTQQEKLIKALAGFESTLDAGIETAAFENFQAILKVFLQANEQVILLSQDNNDDKAQAMSVGTTNDHFEKALALMETMRQTNVVGSEKAKFAADKAANTGVILTLVVSLVVSILVVIVAVWVANSIAQPVLILTNAARQLASGSVKSTSILPIEAEKMNRRQDEMGEIGRAFDGLTRYFQAVIEDLVQVSQGLAAGHLSVIPQSEYRGDFIQIKIALETALSDQRLVIEDIVQISQGLAEGNLRVMPQVEYRGDFIQIKTALETAMLNQRIVIEDIVKVSQGLAAGNLNIMPQSEEYRGDFAKIKNAQETALSNQRDVIQDIVQVSQGLREGQLHVTSQITYQGDYVQIKNALEKALLNLRQVIEDIVHVSKGLAEGEQNITPVAEYQGDFIQIKNSLESAATKLAETTAQNAKQDWLKTGHAQLNNLMSGEQDIEKLAKKIISFLTAYVDAQVGLFYLLTKSKSDKPAYLQRLADYAYTDTDNRPRTFQIGEGLIGQAALECKTFSITQTPEECTHIIRSGLANALPCNILIVPFLHEETLKGIIEIGFSKTLTTLQRDFLEQIMPSLGIAVNSAESRTQMQTLLAQSQRQTEELQTQSEELQAQQEEMQQINEQLQTQQADLQHKQEALQQQNEELQSQSEELQSQSEELQTQQEELKQTNEELEERTKELERQKEDIQQKNLALEKTQVEIEK